VVCKRSIGIQILMNDNIIWWNRPKWGYLHQKAIFLICSHVDIMTGFINFEMKLSLDYKNIIAKIQNDKV
jgi:hypothetical protein